jgi:hypothetical protein
VIVRPHQDQWLLITQPDHAALSARIMESWTARGLPWHPRREIILLATREHDGGWADVDASPIVDPASGEILDFIHVPESIRQEVWPRSVERLDGEPYAAALVAQHAINVYRDHRTKPGWAPFFAKMEELRYRCLSRTPHALETLTADYQFVRLGDLVSLLFASHWANRSDAPRVEGDHTIRVGPGQVIVSPDPFDGAHLSFTLTGRLLSSRTYNDAADAARAFAAAPTVELVGTAYGK